MPEFITIPLIVIAALMLLGAAAVGILLSLRGVLTVAYDGEISVNYRVLFIKIPIYPLPKRKERKRRRWHMSAAEAERIKKAQAKKEERWRRFKARFKSEKKDKEKEKPKETQASTEKKFTPPTKEQIKDVLTDTVDIVAALTEIIAVVVKRFTHHLRIKVARFKVKSATEDAAVTAVTYGAVSQIINLLLPILSTVQNFDLPKQKNFDISADFTTTKTDIDVEVSFSIRVWHFADMGIRALVGGIGKLFSRRKNAKYPIPYLRKSVSEILDSLSKMGYGENDASENTKSKKEKN